MPALNSKPIVDLHAQYIADEKIEVQDYVRSAVNSALADAAEQGQSLRHGQGVAQEVMNVEVSESDLQDMMEAYD